MAAALPITIPARMTPCPPKPAMRSSVVAMAFSVSPVLLAERAGELVIHRLKERRPLDVHEFADQDLALEADAHLFGVGAVAGQAFLLVILHRLEPIAQAVAPLIKGRAGGNDLEKGETLFLEHLTHRFGDLADVEGSPASDVNRAGRFREIGQVEGLLKGAVRSRCAQRRERGRGRT